MIASEVVPLTEVSATGEGSGMYLVNDPLFRKNRRGNPILSLAMVCDGTLTSVEAVSGWVKNVGNERGRYVMGSNAALPNGLYTVGAVHPSTLDTPNRLMIPLEPTRELAKASTRRCIVIHVLVLDGETGGCVGLRSVEDFNKVAEFVSDYYSAARSPLLMQVAFSYR